MNICFQQLLLPFVFNTSVRSTPCVSFVRNQQANAAKRPEVTYSPSDAFLEICVKFCATNGDNIPPKRPKLLQEPLQFKHYMKQKRAEKLEKKLEKKRMETPFKKDQIEHRKVYN